MFVFNSSLNKYESANKRALGVLIRQKYFQFVESLSYTNKMTHSQYFYNTCILI